MKVLIERIDDTTMIDAICAGLPEDKKRIMNDCLKTSTTVWLGLVDSKIACAWGVALPTIMSNRAYLWLWTTDLVKEHPFVFIRRAQVVIKDLLKEYEVVMGVVDATNPGASSSVRWLKLLGARFNQPTSKGLIPFQIRKV
jgi:hypothetical protein